MKFALAGNPNSGKTTLFNTLTGASAHTGNWPGVTVDKKEGTYKKLNEPIDIVDLPGIYSLSPYTPEEIVSRNFIVDEKPDCVINIVDATNLERNLFLTTQILEIDVPVVIALNMMDVVKKNGAYIDVEELSNALGVPVVEISALRNQGIKELMEKAYEVCKTNRKGTTVLNTGNFVEAVKTSTELLENTNTPSALFHAIKLLENDPIELENHPEEAKALEKVKAKYSENEFEGDFESMVADARYNHISKYFASAIKKGKDQDITKSDKIDKVLTHKIWGLPIFLLIIFAIFHVVFSEDFLFLNSLFNVEIVSEGWINFFTGMGYDGMLEEALAAGESSVVLEGIPSLGVFLQSWMGFLTGSVLDLFSGWLEGASPWLSGLVVDGLLTGLDAVCSFIPQILLLFLFISILEDSGYMARIAFVMDRIFRKFGLSGKAFIPLLMGFGCSVPSMMATKVLEDENERDVTVRLSPFFSCVAKAPIWAMLATAIAGSFLGDIFVFSIYFLGIIIAIAIALLIKVFGKRTEVPPFIMELPAYHLPKFSNLMAHLWEKLKHYVYKVSTIITASIILIWFLSNFDFDFWNGMVEIDESILAKLGKVLQYVFYPTGWAMGADGWKYTVSAITGLIAKEEVVATLATLGIEEDAIGLSNAAIYAFAAYNLFTLPCFAAIGTAKAESSKKGFIVTLIWWLAASYVISTVIYWLGTLIEITIIGGLAATLALIAGFIIVAIMVAKKQRA